MTKTRRDFAIEFKKEAVSLLASSGRPLMQVAQELGISPSMLRNWGTALQEARPAGGNAMSPADQAVEITRLRRELDRTRMERDILKKAVGIFAEMPK